MKATLCDSRAGDGAQLLFNVGSPRPFLWVEGNQWASTPAEGVSSQILARNIWAKATGRPPTPAEDVSQAAAALQRGGQDEPARDMFLRARDAYDAIGEPEAMKLAADHAAWAQVDNLKAKKRIQDADAE